MYRRARLRSTYSPNLALRNYYLLLEVKSDFYGKAINDDAERGIL